MQRKPVVIGKPVLGGLSGIPARRGFLLASMLPLCIASASAMELNFSDGAVTGRFDNTISYGAAIRTQGADKNLAAETNGPGPDGFYSELAARNVKTQANKNDGNANFSEAGDMVSNTVKLNSLLELTWENYGAQVSGFAFHDFALADIEDSVGTSQEFSNSVDSNDRYDNRRLTAEAADYAVSDARLSSAYVWGDFEIGGRTLNVRLGEQVLSWGEALFMQDGINQANPADLSALRLPGAEIKDALLPLPMLVISTNLTDALSAEAFYEFGWQRSEADPVGTFYSTTDAFFGYGSESVIVDLEDTTGGADSASAARENLARIYNLYTRGITSATDPLGTRISNNKLDDADPRDDGQYGLALRYMAESLNNTEFGFYFMNYHARKPTAAAVLGDAFGTAFDNETCAAAYTALAGIGVTPSSCADNLNILGGSQGATAAQLVGGLNAIHYIDTSSYFLQYEQNLQVYGLTFSTNIGETSFSGEFAYRPDAEFLPEVGDNLIAYNAVAASTLGNGGTIDTGASTTFGDHIGGGAIVSAGDTVDVTDNEDMLNVSLLAIHNFGPTWIADGLTGVLELGGAWVNGLDPDKRYAAEGALGNVPAAGLTEGTDSQYLNEFAWGYRLVVAADFNDVLAGLNLKPQLRFAHDVDGNGIVGGNFVEDRMSATVALDAEYAGNWTFGIGTNVFWGRDDVNEGNQLADRDNVYANVKYSF
ncbi:MAG: DUF1302 domain-containing protein [Pseudomonadota bacterium]